MGINLKLEGLDEYIKKIKTVEDLRIFRGMFKAIGTYLKGKVSKYAPASEANAPGQRRWYQRGYGSKWMRRDGSTGGRQTSQTLGKRWTVKVIDRGLGVQLANNADYAPFVQDDDRQAWFHRARGWSTVQQVIKDETDYILDRAVEIVEKGFRTGDTSGS